MNKTFSFGSEDASVVGAFVCCLPLLLTSEPRALSLWPASYTRPNPWAHVSTHAIWIQVTQFQGRSMQCNRRLTTVGFLLCEKSVVYVSCAWQKRRPGVGGSMFASASVEQVQVRRLFFDSALARGPFAGGQAFRIRQRARRAGGGPNGFSTTSALRVLVNQGLGRLGGWRGASSRVFSVVSGGAWVDRAVGYAEVPARERPDVVARGANLRQIRKPDAG